MPAWESFTTDALVWLLGRHLEQGTVKWGYRGEAITDAWVSGAVPDSMQAPQPKMVCRVTVTVNKRFAGVWGVCVQSAGFTVTVEIPREDAASFAEELGIAPPAG